MSLVAKRSLDIVLSALSGTRALPIVGGAAIAILFVDPGSPVFVQSRIGRGGHRFSLYKLRTMQIDAENRLQAEFGSNKNKSDPRIHSNHDDPRILPVVGRFLSRYSIDGLPQLWNVLCGDLSLVGPRPLPDYHVELLDLAFQVYRSNVRPRITGLWQVESRQLRCAAAMERYDRDYIHLWSLGLDARILFRTAGCVLRGSGCCLRIWHTARPL